MRRKKLFSSKTIAENFLIKKHNIFIKAIIYRHYSSVYSTRISDPRTFNYGPSFFVEGEFFIINKTYDEYDNNDDINNDLLYALYNKSSIFDLSVRF